jgi:hypothetical protein
MTSPVKAVVTKLQLAAWSSLIVRGQPASAPTLTRRPHNLLAAKLAATPLRSSFVSKAESIWL